MRRNIHPAEELVEIRARIRALKARENELRSLFIERASPAVLRGPSHEVVVRNQKRRVLVKDRLPAAILDDPRFYDLRISPVVKVVAKAASQKPENARNLPAQPSPPTSYAPRYPQQDEESLEVIEAW